MTQLTNHNTPACQWAFRFGSMTMHMTIFMYEVFADVPACLWEATQPLQRGIHIGGILCICIHSGSQGGLPGRWLGPEGSAQ